MFGPGQAASLCSVFSLCRPVSKCLQQRHVGMYRAQNLSAGSTLDGPTGPSPALITVSLKLVYSSVRDLDTDPEFYQLIGSGSLV